MVESKSTVIFISDNQKSIHSARQWAYNHGYRIKTFTSQQWQNGLSNPKFIEQCLTMSSPQVLTSGQVIPFPEPSARLGTKRSQVKALPTINEIQKTAITEAIQRFHGNLTQTSLALGIGRATLYRKVKLYNINLSSLRKSKGVKAA